ncbi:MAG TPA: hypothetical protein VL832_08050 [Puia sp.]|nr:hypothetical protein [Puia sp.]
MKVRHQRTKRKFWPLSGAARDRGSGGNGGNGGDSGSSSCRNGGSGGNVGIPRPSGQPGLVM